MKVIQKYIQTLNFVKEKKEEKKHIDLQSQAIYVEKKKKSPQILENDANRYIEHVIV